MIKPFEGLLGNNCELRLIEFLLPLEGMDFNITELAEEVGISRPTADKIVKKFIEWGIMKVAQRKGGVNYYEFNSDSPFVALFEHFNNLIIESILEEETLYQIHDYWQQHAPSITKEPIPKLEPEPMVVPKFEDLWNLEVYHEELPSIKAGSLDILSKWGRNSNAA